MILTDPNLKAIKGLTRSNQFVIFFPTKSGSITIRELPILLTTMSELKLKKRSLKNVDIMQTFLTYPKTIQNGNISNSTDALIGRCFSSLVIANDAKVKALLSKVS